MQKLIPFSRGNMDAAGLSLPQRYQCCRTRQGMQGRDIFASVSRSNMLPEGCFQKDVTLPWFMRRALLHLSMSAILTSYMALVANKARIAYALANETSRHQQKCEGTSAPSTTTWTIMTLAPCPPRDVCLTSPASTLRCQRITPTSITAQHSPDGKSSHLNIALHVDRQVSPCSRLSTNNRLGDVACPPLEDTWHMHGRSPPAQGPPTCTPITYIL